METNNITYNLEILSLNVEKINDNLENVIKGFWWRLYGTSHDNITADRSEYLTLNEPISENFIDFDDIDYETVSQWFYTSYEEGITDYDKTITLESIKHEIESDIEYERNINIKTITPNWS